MVDILRVATMEEWVAFIEREEGVCPESWKIKARVPEAHFYEVLIIDEQTERVH